MNGLIGEAESGPNRALAVAEWVVGQSDAGREIGLLCMKQARYLSHGCVGELLGKRGSSSKGYR